MQQSTASTAHACLTEAQELELELAYDAAALARYPGAKDANEATGGSTVQVAEGGAWVAIQVWIPFGELGLN
jgi:hypothetical protein